MAQYYSEKVMTIPYRAGFEISEFYLEIKMTHEEEHNATNFKQNPIRYGNSERPQCGRRVKIVARKEAKFIRPEVITMAVEIAQGSNRAIGITSMAFLYCALDNIHHQWQSHHDSRVAAQRDGNRRRELDRATVQREAIATAGGARHSAKLRRSVDLGVSKGTPTQQQKLAESILTPPEHQKKSTRAEESLALSPRSETVLNSSATTHTDPYSEGLAIPRAPDDIGTPSIDLFTSEFPDIAALLDGGADPETGLYLDSPIFPDATQEDHVDSHLPENNEACTEANPDT
uniref:Uncharacterized protein n=1 Tax=Oryza sativa subsp. japonica TaxID=39947 RepID=Q7F096_ORYSJ|nr:hypothetical protein [Oryza sativa Japonica Group]BAD31749.1 hypothetical protein [Oryza sativa Japonica Group]